MILFWFGAFCSQKLILLCDLIYMYQIPCVWCIPCIWTVSVWLFCIRLTFPASPASSVFFFFGGGEVWWSITMGTTLHFVLSLTTQWQVSVLNSINQFSLFPSILNMCILTWSVYLKKIKKSYSCCISLDECSRAFIWLQIFVVLVVFILFLDWKP